MKLNKVFSRAALSLLLSLAAVAAFAQNYPKPGSASASPVPCTDCPGRNRSGELNAGLPTFPYPLPIKAHVGRYVDSVNTSDWTYHFRTARAAEVVVAPTQRGSAPPRVYMQIGSALVGYSIDTFFTSKLPGGMTDIFTGFGIPQHPGVNEVALKPDGFVYAEAPGSGWKVTLIHGQDTMFGFDYDDRGYLYMANSLMGWGIIKDDGRTGGGGFPLIQQVVDNGPGLQIPNIEAKGIASIKAGTEYYTLVFNPGGDVAIYNVTNPTDIRTPGRTSHKRQAIRTFAKTATHDRFAIVDGDNKIQIYDASAYVTGGNAIASFNPSASKQFLDVSVDNDGTFWAIEDAAPGGPLSTNVLWKFAPSGGTYTATSFSVYGEPYEPHGISVRDGYIAIYGQEQGPNTKVYDPRLYKVTNGTPTVIDLKEFFRNYYHYSPAGYAMPEGYTNLVRGFVPLKVGSKVYLIYSDHGLGDVFELQAGDSLTASYNASFGTPNPNSKATQVGPYHGDPITFSATFSTPGFPQNVTWDFGNPEAGAANSAPARTGDPVTYQYRSLSTTAEVTTPRVVKVQLANDSSTNDSMTIVQKAPTPRVVIIPPTGASTVLTNGAAVLPEDKFGDGSDGSIESHYATYLISNADGSNGTTTNLAPNATIAVGALGSRKLTFGATYGPYNASFAPLASPSYVTQISNVLYDVRPFVLSPITASANGNVVTYSATARTTTDATTILPIATTWTVTWSLKNGANVVQTATTTPAIGTISNFVINDKSVINNGSKVELVVTIPAASLGTAAQAFASGSVSQDQAKPSTTISVVNGCANTGQPCKLTTVDTPGASYSWSLTGPVNQNGTGLTFEPSLSQPGNYNVTVTVTSGVFTETSAAFPLTVQGPVCGPLPTQGAMGVTFRGLTSGCTGGPALPCQVGETFEFRAQGWPYQVQACDNFSWSFSDGGTAAGQVVQHTFPGSGPYTASFTISNSSGSAPVTFSATVTFGSGNPGGGTCTAPNGAAITVQGSQGCNGTAAAPCQTSESVTFSAGRAFGTALQQCDAVSWSFSDGAASGQSVYTRQFSTAGPVVVNLTISNSFGQASAPPFTIQIVGGTNPGGCGVPATPQITYQGLSSGCSPNNLIQCQRTEAIQFTAAGTYQNCDQFQWTFGDGTPASNEKNPVHTFAGGAQGYEVALRVHNTSGENRAFRQIRLAGEPLKPTPTITLSSSTNKTGRNAPVTFTAKSTLNATGWTWDFGDGNKDFSQTGVVGTETSIQHVFTTPGPYTVTCSARNAEETAPSPPVGIGVKDIEVTNTPEHRYLLPVVTRSTGFGGSTWRTDVQIFNPDPTVSQSNPMILKMTFNGRNTTKSYELSIVSSTFISEDFMKYFVDGDESGSVSISVMSNYRPQIWTRTYNLAANGTYGQFIPAILLSGDGTAATALPTVETFQYLPGVRSGSIYRTNVGLVNPMDRELTITVTAYSNTYSPLGSTQKKVAPFQLVQFLADAEFANVPKDNKPYTIKITVPANAWLISYASMVDQVSGDPTYLGAVSETEVSTTDFKDLIVPGVGHTGPWRSDVTIFNPDFEPAVVDLAYFNQEGVLSGEAKQITIQGRNFLQLDDLLRAGYLAPQPGDGIGALLIKSTWPETRRFPIAFSRTYNFNGVSTFGQGIPAFSSARANVKPNKPAYIPAVRQDANATYYTNLGLVNLSAQDVTVRVTLLRFDTGAEAETTTFTLKPFQSTIAPEILKQFNAARGSLKVSIEGSTGVVWTFASVIDRRTGDPEYLAGVPTQ